MKTHSQPMDLRDYFATAAMQGMVATISNQFELDRLREWAKQNGQTLSQFIASDSYKQADAMIYEREKGTVESIDATKQKLIEAIGRKHSSLHPNMYMTVDHLIFQLETGLPF
ncbi:hypothetical protein EKS29_14280 [Acinetobacter baumannii]|uniref:hypothetical protein n=1 Tax=Acinetobacter baumannii TaxID=470 RepID=UPI000F821C47|nr:hypothetical protein [Acinetobacter baumannii]EHU1845168.1 hypothetical protein [Acinetobacter baumannii]EHU2403765.1 hypothetical protein [Acinetobacter baumannii]RTY07412.1 hypothetical protein EKS29_14280 [Acinetobacter baumannii]